MPRDIGLIIENLKALVTELEELRDGKPVTPPFYTADKIVDVEPVFQIVAWGAGGGSSKGGSGGSNHGADTK